MSDLNVNAFNKNYQAAMAQAAHGIAVIPVEIVERPGKGLVKKPCITKWKKKATTDLDQIERWWRRLPHALPGIPTGSVSDIAVLDIDKKDGKDGFAALKKLGLDPSSLSYATVRTPTGGLHLYFHNAKGLLCSVGQEKDGLAGVDVRAENGFVVSPGAIGPKGEYRFEKGDLDTLTPYVGLPNWPEAVPMQPRERKAEASTKAEPSGLPLHVLRDALMKMPVEDRERHFGSDLAWFTACRIIADETGASEAGRELWHEWSEGWGGYDYFEAEDKWNREDTYTGERASVWTILRPALNAGWTHPDFEAWRAKQATDETNADFDGPATEADAGSEAPDFGTPLMNRAGKPFSNQHNADYYLARHRDSIMPGLRWNEMTHRAEWDSGEVRDVDLSRVRKGLERWLGTVAMELVVAAVRNVAAARSYHPIRDRIVAAEHDGARRLDTVLIDYFGAEDTTYTRAVGRMFLIGMVARIMRPGCQMDYMIVLSGEQGQKKSTACRVLAGGDAYFSNTLPKINGGKEAMDHLRGLSLVEIAELASMREAAQEDLKNFLTTRIDRFRAAYGKVDEAHPRQCVFMGTTNKDQPLHDETGARRIWMVKCERDCDPEGLAETWDQLFAEAYAAYASNEAWWPERDFEREHIKPVQDAAFHADPWEDLIRAFLDKPTDPDLGGKFRPRREATVAEIMDVCLGIPSERQNRKVEMRVAAILKDRLGWTKHKKSGIVWRRPKGQHLRAVA